MALEDIWNAEWADEWSGATMNDGQNWGTGVNQFQDAIAGIYNGVLDSATLGFSTYGSPVVNKVRPTDGITNFQMPALSFAYNPTKLAQGASGGGMSMLLIGGAALLLVIVLMKRK